jgi:DNA modification methylase
VLRDDGTLWLNLGDSFAGSGKARSGGGDGPKSGKQKSNRGTYFEPPSFRPGSARADGIVDDERSIRNRNGVGPVSGVKPKDLIGIPWLAAFALRADGWYLRSDIIWHKPNPMPESVTDRCTKAHEYIFLLAKSQRYYFDAKAIAEPALYGEEHAAKATSWGLNRKHPNKNNVLDYTFAGDNHTCHKNSDGDFVKNKRSVWTVATQPYNEAHFATFPPALVLPCILAGCPKGGTVLDPFGGAGTVGLVADRNERNAILIELNPEYAAMAERRIQEDAPLFADVSR